MINNLVFTKSSGSKHFAVASTVPLVFCLFLCESHRASGGKRSFPRGPRPHFAPYPEKKYVGKNEAAVRDGIYHFTSFSGIDLF